MARIIAFNAQTKAITDLVVTTVVFNGSDLPTPKVGQSVVGIVVELTGDATHDLAAISRIVVKANGSSIIDCSSLTYRAWFEALSRGGTDPGATAQRFLIPFNLFDEFDEDAQDMCAFPNNQFFQVELTFDGTQNNAGTVRLGHVLSSVKPIWQPMLQTIPMNVVASANSQIVPIREDAFIRAFGFNDRATNGVNRYALKLNGLQRVEGTPEMLRGIAELESPSSLQDNTAPTIWLPIIGLEEGDFGGISQLEIDSGSATTSTDELGIWSMRRQAVNPMAS